MRSKNKRVFNLVGWAIVLIWLGMIGGLVKKSYFKPSPVTLEMQRDGSSLEESETWMAIYHGDDKIGFARSNLRKESEGYKVFESAVMHLRATGAVHRVSTQIVGHLNKDTSLRSFVFRIESGMVRFEATGRVEGETLVLKTGFGGDMRESRVLLEEPPFLSVGLWPYLLKEGLKVGRRYRLSLFDPSIMGRKPVDVEVLAKESVTIDGNTWEAYKVRTSFSGLEMLTWLDSRGERLKEEGLMGLRMVRTTKDEAQTGIRSAPDTDLTESFSIVSNRVLEQPSTLDYLKVRLSGISFEGLDLNSGRQSLAGSVLEIKRESADVEDEAVHVNLAPYLEASPFIQSDDPKIQTLADQIVGAVKEDREKARRILNWIYESIEKRGTVSVPNALDTLRAKAGDCNEHAVLFAALARAVNIPAKVSVGLVYTRGRFYYHAWNEVFLGRWTTLDALMGQMPADVTHIKFIDGDLERQAEMVRVIGKVELTVLEAG